MAILVTCEACKQTLRVRNEYLDKKAWCPYCRAPITLTGEHVSNHEVFISYSNKDKNVADAICATLEALPLRCWIAPRDVTAGHSWGSSIIEAIEEAKVMVLVYSGTGSPAAPPRDRGRTSARLTTSGRSAPMRSSGRSEERRVGKECRSRGSPDH